MGILNRNNPVNGLILAGGHSRRMGSDKGLLAYHQQKPQREFLFELLQQHCSGVYTSCREEQRIPEHLNPIFDRFDIPGPLNGILSAFQFLPSAWLIIAVDMPYINDQAIETLLGERDQTKLATCFLNNQTGEPEPLLTLWEAHALPALMTFYRNGKVSPRTFLRTHPVKLLQPPDEKILININEPSRP